MRPSSAPDHDKGRKNKNNSKRRHRKINRAGYIARKTARVCSEAGTDGKPSAPSPGVLHGTLVQCLRHIDNEVGKETSLGKANCALLVVDDDLSGSHHGSAIKRVTHLEPNEIMDEKENMAEMNALPYESELRESSSEEQLQIHESQETKLQMEPHSEQILLCPTKKIKVDNELDDWVPSNKESEDVLTDTNIHANKSTQRHQDWVAKLAGAHLTSVEDFWSIMQFSYPDQPLLGYEMLQQFNQVASHRLGMKEFLTLTPLLGHVKTKIINNSLYFIASSIDNSQELLEDVWSSIGKTVSLNTSNQPNEVMWHESWASSTEPAEERVLQHHDERLSSFIPLSRAQQLSICERFNIVPQNSELGKISPVDAVTYGPREIRNIIGDGHCFYRAISFSVSGSEDHHMTLRIALHHHMKSNTHLSQFLHLTPSQFEQYLCRKGPMNILNRREWATEAEICFMSHLLGVDIAVYRNNIVRGWHVHTMSVIDPTTAPKEKAKIYIVNTGGNHYDVVLSTQSTLEQPTAALEAIDFTVTEGHDSNRESAAQDRATKLGEVQQQQQVQEPNQKQQQQNDKSTSALTCMHQGPLPGPSGVKSGKRSEVNLDTLVTFWKELSEREGHVKWRRGYNEYKGANAHIRFPEFVALTQKHVKIPGIAFNKKGMRIQNSLSKVDILDKKELHKSGKKRVRGSLLERKELDNIDKFFNEHYGYGSDHWKKISLEKVFLLYGDLNKMAKITYDSV